MTQRVETNDQTVIKILIFVVKVTVDVPMVHSFISENSRSSSEKFKVNCLFGKSLCNETYNW